MHKTLRMLTALVCMGWVSVANATPPTASSAPTAAALSIVGPHVVPICVLGFSKDVCGGSLASGIWTQPVCTVPGNCQTLQGQGAKLSLPVNSNTAACNTAPSICAVGRCDEASSIVGRLEAQIDLNAQRRACCPGRGSWGGDFSITDPLGVLTVRGNMQSSLGVGTHRATTTCTGTTCTGLNCERCYDARFDPTTSLWSLASEGFMEGEVLAGQHAGCRLRASYQGRFTANGDANGPLAPAPSWSFCGNIDGVLECPCH
jgi:hypothetical protein